MNAWDGSSRLAVSHFVTSHAVNARLWQMRWAEKYAEGTSSESSDGCPTLGDSVSFQLELETYKLIISDCRQRTELVSRLLNITVLQVYEKNCQEF